jgi:hypothetical protein
MDEKKPQDQDTKRINFTVVPDEDTSVPRTYSNFCSIQNSPFDFTLTFCEMLPMGERQLQEAQAQNVVKAPVKARLVLPVQMVPGLIAALQENFRIYQESFAPPAPRGPLH